MPQIVRSARNADNVPIIVHVAIDDSQTIAIGDLVQIDATSRKGEAAVAASTTIVGIAMEAITTTTATAADVIPVALVRGQVVRIAYATGGTKTSFATTDKYTTAYDLSNKTTLNPDDTTGGMCYVQAYDNTADTVDVIFADANLVSIG